jgi:hypothetical protein
MSQPVPASPLPARKTLKLRTALPCRSREQALAEGHLVDVSDTARQNGFHWPVAISRAAYEDCVAWTEQDTHDQIFQSSQIRLQSVLFMGYSAGMQKRPAGTATSFSFDLLRIPRDGKSRHAKRTHLRLVAGRDANGEPVLTILLPTET